VKVSTGLVAIELTEHGFGVEIQFSVTAQSDLLFVDLQYLYDEIVAGRIDVGVMIVPSNKLAYFLKDDVATFTDALKDIKRANASHFPLAVLALEHDGPGPSLTKRRPRQGKSRLLRRSNLEMANSAS
jgi:hypothetical protein